MRLLLLAWKSFCYALGALVVAVLLVQTWFFVHVCWWVRYEPAETAFMQQRLASLREKNPKAELRRQWVPYVRISGNLKRAVVAAEDAKFVDHEGFDWEGIQKALEKNEKKGRVVAGGSTISQQLAKNLFLSGSRSWIRKGQEAAITWMIESVMDKRRILEMYLNVAEWGNGVFGAEAVDREEERDHHRAHGRGADTLTARLRAPAQLRVSPFRRFLYNAGTSSTGCSSGTCAPHG
ncbi:MAG: monofunctional biosynthetic peptidoglycan transglycosylase [Betaproteobacteria bacterium]|nr:monofunctional biosynthetic peptidoglycan transglycosylase [Betaproteobacteria bacterium]